ncbi:MAG TPA: TetR/AcrR family transcriptional regulator [Acidimicrobiales bacterium]|nr:TetR/AcrR family transcriptional regulator [Acidimicrobiales bacterium]
MPPVKGQTQKRGDDRRRKILEAALELFGKSGYNGTSLAAVAERVGISPPGILHHFQSKEALLLSVIDEFDNRQQQGLDALSDEGGLAALRRLPELATNVLGDEEFTRLMAVLSGESLDVDGIVHDYFVRRYRVARRWISGLIAKGQERGEIRADIDPMSKAVQVLAIQDGVLNQALLDPSRVDLVKVYEDYIAMLVNDIAAPKPARRRRPVAGTKVNGNGKARRSSASA